MKKKTFDVACEQYFEKGLKKWNSFFDKWEEKASNEEVEEISTHSSSDEVSSESPTIGKRKWKPSSRTVVKSNRKRRKTCSPVPKPDSSEYSDEEAVEVKETFTLEFTQNTNQTNIFSYLSEISRKFANSTPFFNQDFTLNNSHFPQNRSFADGMHLDISRFNYPSADTCFHPLPQSGSMYNNIPDFLPSHITNTRTPPRLLHRMPIYNSNASAVVSSTPMTYTDKLCLPSPTNAISPIIQSSAKPIAKITHSVDSDSDSKDEMTYADMKARDAKAVKRCLIKDEEYKDDDDGWSSDPDVDFNLL